MRDTQTQHKYFLTCMIRLLVANIITVAVFIYYCKKNFYALYGIPLLEKFMIVYQYKHSLVNNIAIPIRQQLICK